MSEALVRFLAREADRKAAAGEPSSPHPDENEWALLADGLVSAAQRDEYLRHAAACAPCRRRLAALVRDWDETILVAAGRPTKLLESTHATRATPQPAQVSAAERQRTPKPWFGLRSLVAATAACIALMAFDAVLRKDGGSSAGGDAGGRYLTRGELSRLVDAGGDLTRVGVPLDRGISRPPSQALSADEYQSTMRKLRRPLRQWRPSADALALATRASLSAADFASAAHYAARWRGVQPHAAEAQNAFGLAEFQLGAHGEALAAFERALELDPDRVEYVLNAGLAADRINKHAAARRYLERVVTLSPNHAQRGEIDALLRRIGPAAE